jgi:hypothetical protein
VIIAQDNFIRKSGPNESIAISLADDKAERYNNDNYTNTTVIFLIFKGPKIPS